jgi:TRAP-type mannitol/chloroaromatic compound transport system substrate-binding protein
VLECLVNASAWNAAAPDLQGDRQDRLPGRHHGHVCRVRGPQRHRPADAGRTNTGSNCCRFPDDVLAELRRHTFAILDELAASDEMVRETWASFRAFMETVKRWTDVGERYLLNHR